MDNKNSHITLLFLFTTLLVMNGMVNLNIVHLIGKWGKFLVALYGISLLTTHPNQLKYFLNKNIWIVAFWLLCILFSFVRILNVRFDFELIQNNVLFIFFIYFYYLLFMAFQNRHKLPDFVFFSKLALVLNVNFFFWSIMAFFLQLNIWETVEGRTGLGMFYEGYVDFGIFACVTGIANFTVLIYWLKTKKVIKIVPLLMFLLMLIMNFLSNSRNSELILVIVILFGIFPFFKKKALRYLFVIVFFAIIAMFYFFSEEVLLDPEVVKFTTGRSSIWSYVVDYYSRNSILLGEGIFGLNNTILNYHINDNYYFQTIKVLYFHSSYLEAFAASGILGFICFMVYMVKAVHDKRKYYLITIIISILVGGLFESFLIQPTILSSFVFWFLLIGPIKNRDERKEIITNNEIFI